MIVAMPPQGGRVADGFLSKAVVECSCFLMILAEMSSYDINYNGDFGL